MEKSDLELIDKHIDDDDELRAYVEEHKRYEEILNRFSERVHLSPEEELEEKKIKKLKLQGRDEIERILANYRKQESS